MSSVFSPLSNHFAQLTHLAVAGEKKIHTHDKMLPLLVADNFSDVSDIFSDSG